MMPNGLEFSVGILYVLTLLVMESSFLIELSCITVIHKFFLLSIVNPEIMPISGNWNSSSVLFVVISDFPIIPSLGSIYHNMLSSIGSKIEKVIRFVSFILWIL